MIQRLARNPRVRRLAANSWEAWVGAAAIQTAYVFLSNPEALAESPIGRTFHPFDYAWAIGYGLAGLLIIAGLIAPAHRRKAAVRTELAGLTLFVMGGSLQLLSLVVLLGLASSTSLWLLAGAILAALGRAWTLARPRVVTTVAIPEEEE